MGTHSVPMLQVAWTQPQIIILLCLNFSLAQREFSMYGNPTPRLKQLLHVKFYTKEDKRIMQDSSHPAEG